MDVSDRFAGGDGRGAGSAVFEPLESRLLLDAAALGAPDLDANQYIYDGGSPLQVGVMSAPSVVDWNGDGAKDLLVGQFTHGKIWLYLNQGTDRAPVLKFISFLQAGGRDIRLPAG